jgi:uncharacterized integral membrane protein
MEKEQKHVKDSGGIVGSIFGIIFSIGVLLIFIFLGDNMTKVDITTDVGTFYDVDTPVGLTKIIGIIIGIVLILLFSFAFISVLILRLTYDGSEITIRSLFKGTVVYQYGDLQIGEQNSIQFLGTNTQTQRLIKLVDISTNKPVFKVGARNKAMYAFIVHFKDHKPADPQLPVY